MLAFVLRELYDRRRADEVLRIEDYNSIGGLSDAISKVAEGCISEKLPMAPEAAFRMAILRLARLDDTRRYVRRAARWVELPPPIHLLFSRVIRARLLASFSQADQPLLEVAHEAVFTAWPRIAEWLLEDQEKLALLRRISQAANNWVRVTGIENSFGKARGSTPQSRFSMRG